MTPVETEPVRSNPSPQPFTGRAVGPLPDHLPGFTSDIWMVGASCPGGEEGRDVVRQTEFG